MAPSESGGLFSSVGRSEPGLSGLNTFSLQPPATYRLHGDFDRDGHADGGTWFDAPRWDWGDGNPGAVIPFNNDDDGGRSGLLAPLARDFTDDRVNANDVELAPLMIRRHGGDQPAAARFKACLEVPAGQERFIRIHNGRTAGRSEVIGPARGRRHAIHDMSAVGDGVTLGMEALRYAGRGFDGLIDIRLTVYLYDYDGRFSDDENFDIMENTAAVNEETYVRVRVAPWMVPHHLDRAERVYVVTLPGGVDSPNRAFRERLDGFVTGAGCAFNQNHTNDDRWMQDCMEIGYSVMPGDPRPHRWTAVLRCLRGRGLYDFPPELAARDVGWFEPNVPDFAAQNSINPNWDTTFDSGGNIECTPPVRASDGTVYPFGRIYYGPGGGGERFDPVTADFFDAQVVQAPIALDTNWLSVGHVDEMLSFVPRNNPPNVHKRWKLVVASPQAAYQILDEAAGDEVILQGRRLSMKRRVWIEDWVDEPVYENRQVPVWVENWVRSDTPLLYRDQRNRWHGRAGVQYNGPINGFSGRWSSGDWAPYRVWDANAGRYVDNFPMEDRGRWENQWRRVQVGVQAVDHGWYEVETEDRQREQTVDDFLNDRTMVSTSDSEHMLRGADLRDLNLEIWYDRIVPVLQQLEDAIGLAPEDVISVPVVFYPTNAQHTEFGALTADIVNMLVVNGHVITPYAYGPQRDDEDSCRFERDFRTKMEAENLTVHFINDWTPYHSKHGEVHCGTNTLRLPNPMNDWLESAAARWWEYTP
ncbi:MAG: protein-arginine deiminase domain-containing protein [Alphaproteobacteria bacterium]|nr:protein-arginine deiminase domain-containing protein [Alphaproteobacteria bacterium]